MNVAAEQKTALVARLPKPAAAAEISAANWQLITDVIWPNAKDPLVILTAWNYCLARKLDPMKRPIHIVSTYSKLARKQVETIWPGIGELQTTAARSGKWAGMDPPIFGPMVTRKFKGHYDATDNGPAQDVEIEVTFPEWGRVVVYRMVAGERRGFSEDVFWLEAYARVGFRSELPNEMWARRPRGQFTKVCKAFSLRAAFPEDIGGDYSAEEMEGQTIEDGGITIEGTSHAVDPKPDAEALPYHIIQPDGSTYNSGLGSAWIADWRTGIAAMAGQPQKILKARTQNWDAISNVSTFDPAAGQEVREMLRLALGEGAP